jgi:predicted HAD superfamily Cof-like phosphohydrolase
MRSDVFADVKEFHDFFGHTINNNPTWLSVDRTRFRLGLIDEETTELKDAISAHDMVEVADALADLIYVTIGTAVEMGIPLDHVWDMVHKANMRKGVRLKHDANCDLVLSNPANPQRCSCGAVIYTTTGKIAKPEGWKAPNDEIRFLLAR